MPKRERRLRASCLSARLEGAGHVISSIEITRFRGIREGKLEDLTPLVVLVGPNASGKSSVLDALLVAGSRPIREGITQVVQRHQGLRYGARWLFWRTGIHGSSQIKVEAGRSGKRTCNLTPLQPDRWTPFPVKCEIQENTGAVRTGSVLLEFVDGNTVAASSGREPDTPVEILPGARLVEGHREDSEVPLNRLVTKAAEHGALEQLSEMIRELSPDLRDVRILTEADSPVVHLVRTDHSVPAALAGDGLYSLLRMSAQLATRREGTVLLEEPEVHQHPGAMRQTIRAILAAVRRDIQVILTTHSLELIDQILAESSDEDIERLSLYRLQLADGNLMCHRMAGDDVRFARVQIENDLR